MGLFSPSTKTHNAPLGSVVAVISNDSNEPQQEPKRENLPEFPSELRALAKSIAESFHASKDDAKKGMSEKERELHR
jgi:hypothetical protein